MPSLVTVESFTSPWDAHVTRGLLESEGIPATLASEHHVWSNWPFSLALGGVRLQVPEQFADQAHVVLRKQRDGDFQLILEEQQNLPAVRCQNCGSSDLRYVRSPWSLLLLVATLGLSGVIFPPSIEGWKCNACKTRLPGAL